MEYQVIVTFLSILEVPYSVPGKGSWQSPTSGLRYNDPARPFLINSPSPPWPHLPWAPLPTILNSLPTPVPASLLPSGDQTLDI